MPIDFVVFDGLDDAETAQGELRRIVFAEVKTGQSSLSRRERLVRDAVLDKRVDWKSLHLAGGAYHPTPKTPPLDAASPSSIPGSATDCNAGTRERA